MIESSTLCVNDARYFHRCRIKQIETPLDLLAWLDTQQSLPKAYWQGRDGTEVAACGSALMLFTPPKFNGGNDSSARFWGGHSFFSDPSPKDDVWKDFPQCGFFVPQIEIIKKKGVISCIQNSINSPLPEEIDLIPGYFQRKEVSIEAEQHFPPQEKWTVLVSDALEKIREDIFTKVVLARRSTHKIEGPLKALELLGSMHAKNSIRFAIQFSKSSIFIGVTPERLYLRKERNLFTEALAGTCRIDEPETALLDSKKDLHEFSLVKTSIQKKLEPVCQTFCSDSEDRVIQSAKAQHLYNPFKGVLKEGVCDSDILAALHPTAAVGGFPNLSALEHLEKHEPFDRGWYASPFGYISLKEAQLCVGIRSALVEANQMHLFAGAGIVKDSQPEKEWEELGIKTSLWTDH